MYLHFWRINDDDDDDDDDDVCYHIIMLSWRICDVIENFISCSQSTQRNFTVQKIYDTVLTNTENTH